MAEHIVAQLKSGELGFAADDPDDPANFPRALTVWRANLLGSSGKGNEYFLRHLLGTDAAARSDETPPEGRPVDVTWRDDAPEGKLDLLTSIDFRMTSTGLFADVVLPAATWYEKHDLSTTDMHPYVHAFNPAISPPWQARSDYDAFLGIADAFSRLAADHLGTRTDVLAVPLAHDTPDELAQPGGRVLDWKHGECEPVPGKTMPKLVTIERDYAAIGQKMRAIGPLLDTLGTTTKGVTYDVGRSWRTCAARTACGRPPGSSVRRWRTRNTCARRSSRCRRPPTDASPHRVSARWSGAPAPGWPTSPRSTRASGSSSRIPRRARRR